MQYAAIVSFPVSGPALRIRGSLDSTWLIQPVAQFNIFDADHKPFVSRADSSDGKIAGD